MNGFQEIAGGYGLPVRFTHLRFKHINFGDVFTRLLFVLYRNFGEQLVVDHLGYAIFIEPLKNGIQFLISCQQDVNYKIENFRIQGNKIYFYNDRKSIFDIDAVIKMNPLNMADIGVVIEYALEVSRFLLGYLTRILKPEKYVNINDWKNTLRLIQVGEKNREVHIVEPQGG